MRGFPSSASALQTTRELEEPGAVVAGPFHPAFRALVETALFLELPTPALLRRGGRRLSSGTAGADRLTAPLYPLPPPTSPTSVAPRGGNIAALKERFSIDDIRATPLIPPFPADT